MLKVRWVLSYAFVANFIRFPTVQKFWKSVKIWQSYREFKGGNFFGTQCSYPAIRSMARMHNTRGALQIQARSPQSRPVAKRKESQTISDATGLNWCGDQSCICNIPRCCTISDADGQRCYVIGPLSQARRLMNINKICWLLCSH